MALTHAEARAIVEELFSCRDLSTLNDFIQRRPAAAAPEVQQAAAVFLERRIGTPSEGFTVAYFDAVVNARLGNRRRWRWWRRFWARIKHPKPVLETDVWQARSWSELVQAQFVALLNDANAEPAFGALIDLAEALAPQPEVPANDAWQIAIRAAVGCPSLERSLDEFRRLVKDGEWSRLPIRGDSLQSLHRIECGACESRSWRTFWNYIGRWDWTRRKQLANGDLNAMVCLHCGSTDVETIAVTAISSHLRLAALPRFTCCETERSLVFRMPEPMRRHDPEIGTAVHALASYLARRNPRGPRDDLDAWDFTFTQGALRGKIGETAVSTDPGELGLHFAREVLVPFALSVRNGAVALDPQLAEIAEAIEVFNLVRPRGVAVLRGDFESREPERVAIHTVVAFFNEQCGHFALASIGYITAAEEAVSAGRWGEVAWLVERAEQTAQQAKLSDADRQALLRGAAQQRASMHFALGDVQRASGEMFEIVDLQQERLREEKDELQALLQMIDLAGSLNSSGDYQIRRNLAKGRELLLDALDLCDRAERHSLFASIPERSRQFWALSRSGALNNYARSCQEIKMAVIVAARLGSVSIDDPAVRWYFEDGVTLDQLNANIEAIRDEFPNVLDNERRIHYPDLVEELDRTSIEYYRRALQTSSKFNLHRYAALQWSNLSNLYRSRGAETEAAECARNADREARASGHMPAIVEADLAAARLAGKRGETAQARAKLVEAYEFWVRMRRFVMFDELRVTAGRQIEPILDRIGSVIDDAPPDEWIATLERMKAGSLADSLLAPPLRLADMPDDEEVQRLRDLETRLAAAREHEPRLAEMLEREHEAQLHSVLLRRPYLAGGVPELGTAAEFLAAVRARYAGVTFLGLWLDDEDLLVYGLTPDGQSFALRHPLLQELQFAARVPFDTIDAFLNAYRATAAADLPPENLAQVLGEPWFRAVWLPIEEQAGRITRAVISPHGRLRGFPWSTMWTGQQWMVNRTTISEVVAVMGGGAAKQLAGRPQRVLILADPDLGNRAFALPGARTEAKLIESFDSQSGVTVDVRLGRDATRDALLAEAATADVVHLACHGSFDAKAAWKSALYLSGRDAAGRPTVDAVTMEQIAHYLKLRPGALVVLSACETAKAQYRAADEAAGLARSFHLAGAANVIAALWPVEDAATADLMNDFYTHLLFREVSPAQALALAQREMIENARLIEARAPWESPSRWGAFVVYER